jgi:hypothetical protein
LKKLLDLDEAMLAGLLEPLDVLLVRCQRGTHRKHTLEVEALLVAHLEPADRARPDVASVKVGSSMIRSASVWSPVTARCPR